MVSAEIGVDGRPARRGARHRAEPDPTLDLLWSTGELRSAALLALSLQARACAQLRVNVHQTGLTEPDTAACGAHGPRALRLARGALGHDVVVAPGFLARGDGDALVSLGRGGSDLTAVLLAAGLGAASASS